MLLTKMIRTDGLEQLELLERLERLEQLDGWLV